MVQDVPFLLKLNYYTETSNSNIFNQRPWLSDNHAMLCRCNSTHGTSHCMVGL